MSKTWIGGPAVAMSYVVSSLAMNGMRPEWLEEVKSRWFAQADVGSLDAPDVMPAGACCRWEGEYVCFAQQVEAKRGGE